MDSINTTFTMLGMMSVTEGAGLVYSVLHVQLSHCIRLKMVSSLIVFPYFTKTK